MIRGAKHLADYFISQLQGKFLPYEIKGDTSKARPKGTYQTPVHVRPIQLFEIVFPEEHKDIMLTTLLGKKLKSEQYKKVKTAVAFLRKMLGVQPIPEYDDKIGFPITRDGLEIFGVGTKEDTKFADGTEAL